MFSTLCLIGKHTGSDKRLSFSLEHEVIRVLKHPLFKSCFRSIVDINFFVLFSVLFLLYSSLFLIVNYF